MEKDDVQLIQSVLSGNDEAFTALVGKYQKSVHALVWRKIGDFHFAEEIMQDTFLQAYKKLATLRNPNQFAGWLYVIADNLCKRWYQKQKLRKVVSRLKMKSYHLPIACILFLVFLTTAFAQNTPLQDTAKEGLDLKALLTAIKHHHALLKSGEGEVVYTIGVPPFVDTETYVDTDTDIVAGTIVFNTEKTRFDSEKTHFHPQGSTTILTATGLWEIVRHKHRNSDYRFSTEEPLLISPFHDVDPRRWLTLRDKNLATYLKNKNFQITGREGFKNSLCYVLEAKDGDRTEKIWIAPDQGFQYLKHERQYPRPVDALDSEVPMEALRISRTTISYQQHGEIWFPKAVFNASDWLDFKPKDPIISVQMLELKNFKINHDIPPETFTVDIPDDAMITVNHQKQKLSKMEFLKQYGQRLPGQH